MRWRVCVFGRQMTAIMGRRRLQTMSVRLGIDVGGTFTDLALVNDATGEIKTEKVLTTPSDPWVGIHDGVQALLTQGVDAREIDIIIHGTTLVINALIERR